MFDQAVYYLMGAMFIFTALVMVFVSIPLIRKRVPMNKTYGVRVPEAFASEENWYTINQFGGKQLVFCSIGIATAGVLLCIIQPFVVSWCFGMLISAPLWLFVIAAFRIKSFARRLS